MSVIYPLPAALTPRRMIFWRQWSLQIYEFVKRARNDYYARFIEVARGYEFSQYQTLRTIELYHNSQFETGKKGSLKRGKTVP